MPTGKSRSAPRRISSGLLLLLLLLTRIRNSVLWQVAAAAATTTVDLMLRPRDDCGGSGLRALRELFFVSLYIPVTTQRTHRNVFSDFFIPLWIARPFYYTHSRALYKSTEKKPNKLVVTRFSNGCSVWRQSEVVLGYTHDIVLTYTAGGYLSFGRVNNIIPQLSSNNN